jgi:hypothetical protein
MKTTKNEVAIRKKLRKWKNMQWNLPLVLKLVLKLRALTCTWQGQGKYHTNQTKQSCSTRRVAM